MFPIFDPVLPEALTGRAEDDEAAGVAPIAVLAGSSSD